MSDGVAAVDATPLRTARRALLRAALVGGLVGAPVVLHSGALALALLAGVATLVGACALVEGWARGRGHAPAGFVATAGALLAPAAGLQVVYALERLGGMAPALAVEAALREVEVGQLVALALSGALALGLASRVRHCGPEDHGEVLQLLGSLSLVTFCAAPVVLVGGAALVWGLAGLYGCADWLEQRLVPLVDEERLVDLRRRLAEGQLRVARLRAAAWAGDPFARAAMGAAAPTPPGELRTWVRHLATFDPDALQAAARAVSALAEEERAARPAAHGTLLEQAMNEAARAITGEGAGGSSVGHGPVGDAAVRAGWAAAFAADALGEATVRARIREAVAAWAFEERAG